MCLPLHLCAFPFGLGITLAEELMFLELDHNALSAVVAIRHSPRDMR
jgi:hypothetical protein